MALRGGGHGPPTDLHGFLQYLDLADALGQELQGVPEVVQTGSVAGVFLRKHGVHRAERGDGLLEYVPLPRALVCGEQIDGTSLRGGHGARIELRHGGPDGRFLQRTVQRLGNGLRAHSMDGGKEPGSSCQIIPAVALGKGEVAQPVVPAQDLCGGQIVLGVGDTLQVAGGTADLRFEDVSGVADAEGEVTVEGGECRIAVRHGRYPPKEQHHCRGPICMPRQAATARAT
ncbi:hypothetical protein [Streptomyces sp. NPDC004284]|uniref:hypothetical protein n=1 Tax=Streptomyces sp. NPDC004284 TaxID=3364695 RepID=UPI00369DA086